MSKDNRKIISGVPVGGTTYTEGREDELAALLTPEQAEHLKKQGAIEGDWAASGKKAEKVADDSAKVKK